MCSNAHVDVYHDLLRDSHQFRVCPGGQRVRISIHHRPWNPTYALDREQTTEKDFAGVREKRKVGWQRKMVSFRRVEGITLMVFPVDSMISRTYSPSGKSNATT
jgi:hypothetical protein